MSKTDWRSPVVSDGGSPTGHRVSAILGSQ